MQESIAVQRARSMNLQSYVASVMKDLGPRLSELEVNTLTNALKKYREHNIKLDANDRIAYLQCVERIRVLKMRETFNPQTDGQMGAS